MRIKVDRRWRTGIAVLLPEYDARDRQRLIGSRFNAAVVRMMGTDLLSVRVDLEPSALSGKKHDNELAAQPQTSAGPANPDRKSNS